MNNTGDTTNAPNNDFIFKDHTNSIGDNDNKNAKDRLGVTALIAIMEPATDDQSFRAKNKL